MSAVQQVGTILRISSIVESLVETGGAFVIACGSTEQDDVVRAGIENQRQSLRMRWKESSVMDERMRFVIRLQDGESMASQCRNFGISRKTGYCSENRVRASHIVSVVR